MNPYLPRQAAIVGRTQESPNTFTLELRLTDGEPYAFSPGQFNMLYRLLTIPPTLRLSWQKPAIPACLRTPFAPWDASPTAWRHSRSAIRSVCEGLTVAGGRCERQRVTMWW